MQRPQLLEKVVPEIIEPAAQYHLPAGKGHDMLYFLPVLPAVAVDPAMLAGRFRIERTSAPLQQGILHECAAILTETYPFREDCRHSRRKNCPLLPPMPGSAVDADKLHEDLEIFHLTGVELFH